MKLWNGESKYKSDGINAELKVEYQSSTSVSGMSCSFPVAVRIVVTILLLILFLYGFTARLHISACAIVASLRGYNIIAEFTTLSS